MPAETRFHPRIEGAIRSIFKRFGIGITGYSRLQQLTEGFQAAADLKFLGAQPEAYIVPALRLLARSKSQFRQDLFALTSSGMKRGGYFVEFGATNGVDLSNTWLLEKEFGWRGILAEPGKIWHEALRQNRSSVIETNCVWSASGQKLDFKETAFAELSTVKTFASSDAYASARQYGISYQVETISLQDLLDKHRAPRNVDYLSIDTEGSELEILSGFDFNSYRFSTITCEHNHRPVRDDIRRLLASHGYERKFEDISQYDDWFVCG